MWLLVALLDLLHAMLCSFTVLVYHFPECIAICMNHCPRRNPNVDEQTLAERPHGVLVSPVV